MLAFNNSYTNTPADMNLIDGQLSKGCSVVVGVDPSHNPAIIYVGHYVEIYKKNSDGTYQCRDPWFKDDTNFNLRYAVNGMTVEQCILQAISYNGTVQEQGTYVDSATFTRLVANSTEDDAFHAAGYANPQAVTEKIKDLNNQIEELKNKPTTPPVVVPPVVVPPINPQPTPTPAVDYKVLYLNLLNDLKLIKPIVSKFHWFYSGDFKSILAIISKYV
jgi:hypothetical protein